MKNFKPISKRKRKKFKSKMYRGVYIEQSGAYSAPYDTPSMRVIAFTPDIERYFPSMGKAKQYIDKHFNRIHLEQNAPWLGIEPIDFGGDDIPF